MPRGMPDGYRTRVTFADFPLITLYAKSVTPMGLEGGDGIDTTTMENDIVKTKWPQSLIEVTSLSFTAAYWPSIYGAMTTFLNVITIVTVEFANGSSVYDYGWIRSFKPNKHEIGQQPTAEVIVEFACETGADPVVESVPTYVEP